MGMNDADILAVATARYEAFHALLPKVLDDLKAISEVRDVKLGYEVRAEFAAAAAAAAVRLVVGNQLDT
jgi:hypothetical protein